MHSPRVAAVNYARSDLQRLYDYYLRTICDLLPSTPRKMLLAELGLLPLQVFWWRQTMPDYSILLLLEQLGRIACGLLLPHCLFGQSY